MEPKFEAKKAMQTAVQIAERLVNEESTRRRVNRPVALEIVAKEAGLSPWTLMNLLRGRVKFPERIAGQLNGLLERQIERRIAELQTELAYLRAKNDRAREADLLAAEAAIAEARRLIRREG